MKEMIKEIIREEMGRMYKQYYFMAGLPRSGSTMLSAILNQNPRFHSGPSSPVVPTMLALENSLANDELYRAYPKPEMAREIISSVLSNYYLDVNKPVVFDKNRSWVNRIHYIRGYFGIQSPKILCPVRDTAEILTSFITMIRRNQFSPEGKINFIDEMLIKNNVPLTDENRCTFMASGNGILGQSYDGLTKALIEGNQKCLHFIEYKDLVSDPEGTMRKVYEFLGEEYFEHDFNSLKNLHKENDAEVYGISDMHDVRSEVKSTAPNPEEILPESILQRCLNSEFWRNLDQFEQYQQQESSEEVNDSQPEETESKSESESSDEKLIG